MPNKAAFSRAAEAAALAVDPMEDINNTAAYRRSLVRTLFAARLGDCSMSDRREIRLIINSADHTVAVEPRRTLGRRHP